MLFTPLFSASLLLFFASLLNATLAFFIIFGNRSDHTRFTFSIVSFLLSLWCLSIGILSAYPPAGPLALKTAFGVCIPIPFLTLLLSKSFPQGKISYSKTFIFLFFLPSLILFILLPGDGLLNPITIQNTVLLQLGLASYLYIFYYLVYFTIAGVNFFTGYQKSNGLAKMQYGYFFSGILISSVIGILFNVIMVVFLNCNTFVYFGPLGTIFLIALTAYAITKHRLMDITVVIGRTFALGVVSLVYFVLFAGLWVTLSYFHAPQIIQLLGCFVYMLFMGLTFRPVWDATITTADKTFIKGWYDYRIVQRKLSDKLKNVAEKHDILPAVQEIFDNEMEIKDVQIVFLNHQDAGKLPLSLVEEIKESKEVALLPKGSILPKGVAIPCFLDGHLEAIILVGPKRSEASFNEVDFDLFRTLSGEVSVILQRAKPLEKALDRAATAEETADKAAKEAALLREVALQLQHEVKNPLAAIDLQTRSLPDHWEDKKWREEHVMRVRRSVELISATMDDLGEYGTLKISEKYPVDINELVNEAIFIWQSHFEKAGISVEKNLGKLPLIKANPDSLQRVFLNLCVNAAQAMKEGGVFTVTTYPGQHQAKDKIVDGIIIKIKDTGEGIPKENFEKIFRFKFTTRYEGKGRGLSLGYLIITEGHNGIISFESPPAGRAGEVGKGTEFTIALPL